MVFIRKNKYILAMILGIVSMALMFPSITNMIKNMKDTAASGYDISVQIVLVLIEYICIFLSELIFIIIGARRMMDKVLFLEKFSVEPQQPEMPFSPDEMMAAAMAGAPMMTPPMEASENVEEVEEATNSEMLVQTVEDNNEEE